MITARPGLEVLYAQASHDQLFGVRGDARHACS